MFDPWCPTCARRVLLGTRRIVRLRRTEDDRLHLDLRCFCGTVVGSASTAARPVVGSDHQLVASAAPAGPDASPPRPAEDASPPPAAAGRSWPAVA